MTIRKLYKKKYGNKEYQKLSPRLKRLFERIDSLPVPKKPLTFQELKKALQ